MLGEYRTPKGRLYHFSGWDEGDTPLEYFDRGEWLHCLHSCMLMQYLLEDVADDGLLHELVHLSLGIDICTHTTMTELRGMVASYQSRFKGNDLVNGQQ